jgi:hypothetical protein
MIKNFKLKMAGVAVILAMASCTNRILDFTMVSSKNIDLSRGASFERGKSRVTGEEWRIGL